MGVRGIDNMLIHFIGNHIGIVFLHQTGNHQHFFPGEYLAAGVGGIAQNQRFRPLTEGIFQHLGVKVKGRRLQGYIDRLRIAEHCVRTVVLVKRGKHGHSVPGIGDGHHGCHHGLGAAAGNDNLRFRVNDHAHETGLFFRQGLAEIGRTQVMAY